MGRISDHIHFKRRVNSHCIQSLNEGPLECVLFPRVRCPGSYMQPMSSANASSISAGARTKSVQSASPGGVPPVVAATTVLLRPNQLRSGDPTAAAAGGSRLVNVHRQQHHVSSSTSSALHLPPPPTASSAHSTASSAHMSAPTTGASGGAASILGANRYILIGAKSLKKVQHAHSTFVFLCSTSVSYETYTRPPSFCHIKQR